MESVFRESFEHSIVIGEPIFILHLLKVFFEECGVIDLDWVFEYELNVIQPLVQAFQFNAYAEKHASLHLLVVQVD
jgi:hypothetical protein